MDFQVHNINGHIRLLRLVEPALTKEIMIKMCINDKSILLAFVKKVISEVKLE